MSDLVGRREDAQLDKSRTLVLPLLDGTGRAPWEPRVSFGGAPGRSSEAVFAHYSFKLVKREGVGRVAVAAGHGFGGGQGVDDGLFHGLCRGVEEGADLVQGEHLDVKGSASVGDMISGGEGQEDVAAAVMPRASGPGQTDGGPAWLVAGTGWGAGVHP